MKRGAKPKGKVEIKWSAEFAYAIGLLVTDGNLSPDGRHINMTSKDLELITNFLKALNTKSNIGKKASGSQKEKKYYVVQIGDVLFYRFLQVIGLMPNKTKIIGEIQVPGRYFLDFARGHFDGDGSSYSYFDKRWKSSFMFYASFLSASKKHIEWLRQEINKKVGVKGRINKGRTCYQLRYAKRESLKLIAKLYYNDTVMCLPRKRTKIEQALKSTGMH